jgi:hypothetical protein
MNACAIAVLAAVIALALAGCADDENSTTKTTLSLEQKVEQAGNKWARLFASADPAACGYMTQPGCVQVTCKRPPTGTTIRTCTRTALRKSFADATVQEVAIKGKRAVARFSNGERVELFWVNGYAVGGIWWIDKVQPNAKLDEVDREAGVRFNLHGRVLTARLLASAPSQTRSRVRGARIRATCGKGFTGGQSDPRQTRTRLWTAGIPHVRFRFRRDISRIARWCRLEDPVVGHVAFVKLGS